MSAPTTSGSAPTSAPSALPSGITGPQEFISATDQGGVVAILAAFSLGLVFVSFPIRIYVRRQLNAYKLDDYSFLGASVFSILQAAAVFYMLKEGFGKSDELIDPSKILPIQKAAYIADILYIFTLFLSKCSTAFLFVRLTPGKGHSLAIWSTIWLSVGWAFISIFLVSIRCHPDHPWTDTTSSCSNLFTRWQFVGALDILTEIALFAISVYLIWGIQMSMESKATVVGAFGCRLPVIAIIGVRLYYLQIEITSLNPTLMGAAAVSCSQLEIGYSIMASIVPCLKNFMAPYEKPIATQTGYPRYGNNSSLNYELSSVASKGEAEVENRFLKGKALGSNPSTLSSKRGERVTERDIEEEGVVSEGYSRRSLKYFAGKGGLGKLRPEQINYEARVQSVGGDDRRSVDSGNSRRMIIRKGVEWSVNYDARTASPGDEDR